MNQSLSIIIKNWIVALDNAIREFSLAEPSWVMSPYTMLYKYGKHRHDFLVHFHFYLSLVF